MAMTKTDDFIARLHLIAGQDPEDGQKLALREAFARFEDDAQQSVRADDEGLRKEIINLRNALRAASVEPGLGHAGVLLDYARKLVADWLDGH
jgi:hypothetical protein